jgi:hypothetical protein
MNDENVLCEEMDRAAMEDQTFSDWQQYPANVVSEPSAVNAQSYRDRISRSRSRIFSQSSYDTDLEIIDIRGKSSCINTELHTQLTFPGKGSCAKISRDIFSDSESAEQHLTHKEAPGTRIM